MTNAAVATSPYLDADSKREPSEFGLMFAELLTIKFSNESGYASKCFTVQGGNKFDRIVQKNPSGAHSSVHAFVAAKDITDKQGNVTIPAGSVLKAAGWNAPAKGVRYSNILKAAEKADLLGGYLYAK